MKNLDKNQKIIWEHSSKIELPNPPDIHKSWRRLYNKLNQRVNQPVQSDVFSSFFLFMKSIFYLNKGYSYRSLTSISLALSFVVYFSLQAYINLNFITHDTPHSLIRLPDGSSSTLNALSSIKYKRNFNKHRELTLSGEAFFDVIKSDIPFIITTKFGEVKVLGTSFNVRSRDDGFEVGVNEGIVKVSNGKNTFLIKEDEMIKINPSDPNKNQNIVKAYKNYPDWVNNILFFENTPISEACREIERTFDITINFSKSEINNIKITGIIETTDIYSVLSSLSLLTKHNYKLEGEICTIF
tara:strand:- start:3756 stop:4649 length:894 start_codon:yes stop_codon:yes gene_type:complete